MCPRPVIGIPADRRQVDIHPFHMVGEKYIAAVHDGAEGLPLLIPVTADPLDFDDVLRNVDGLFLTGSPSNVEPHHYDGEASRPGTWHDPERDSTTLPLAQMAMDAGVPLFAVCRGFQELNVVLGGTLHQHLEDVEGLQNHKEDTSQPIEVQYGPSHEVNLVEGGLLHGLAGASRVMVNSLHGQGIARLADGVIVEALADDGLIEAFRVDGTKAFALAVQWHPEWRVLENEFSAAMFKEFGNACREYAAQK